MLELHYRQRKTDLGHSVNNFAEQDSIEGEPPRGSRVLGSLANELQQRRIIKAAVHQCTARQGGP